MASNVIRLENAGSSSRWGNFVHPEREQIAGRGCMISGFLREENNCSLLDFSKYQLSVQFF